jgi:(p)ppGpp synthase/HD superfamily hydrolase
LAIAALLHDAVEDQGGIETLEVIQTRFGEKVARIVFECSDALVTPKPPWRERKEYYLAHLETVGEDTLLVSLADKLHNARSILADLEQLGQAVWERFNGGKAGTLWYYQTLANFFLKSMEKSQLAHELNRVVHKIERLAVVDT